MIGRTLAHYRITAGIGSGGMGEVYRATDTRLGRDVALKVLPAEMASSPERLERFRREARAVAALNHPHIVTIHSVEEADGVHFLTMELVEGKALDKLLAGGALSLERIVEIGAAISGALAVAHDKGIIHRDLKPANVMVGEDGSVKVLDFGLAKISPAGETTDSALPTEAHTRDGVVMGTVPYMSPEQISGRPVDNRSDVFSLGVVLYEMASGRRPFEGASAAELASAILRDTPPAVTDLRPELPSDLVRIIRRCLEKDTRRRFQTARDVGNELRDMSRQPSTSGSGPAPAPAAARSDPSGASRLEEGFWIAVLPFKHRGSDPGVEALAEGITEDIVTGMSRFSYLRVIARGATSRYAGEAIDVRTVGQELGAQYVMEGSIRQTGAMLRVAVQLVDASSGAHLWAETYNRPFSPEKIFELQDQVVPPIVSTVADLNGVLPRTMSGQLRHRDPESLNPYEAVLRAFGYYERLTEEEHAEVRSALERAVEEAPDHADCWALLSMLYAEEHKHGFNVRPDPLGRALDAARKAVAAAPSSSLAYHMLAQARFFRRELAAFRTAADRAVALNPMDGCTIAFMGILMSYAGDWDEGCALSERAMQLNPHHPGWYRFGLFNNAYRKGDYRDAVDIALKFNMPSYYYTHLALAAAYGQLGEMEAAGGALRELLALKPDAASVVREEFERWTGEGELLDAYIDGLRKAGLDVPFEGAAGAGSAALRPDAVSRSRPVSPASGTVGSEPSGASRLEEGFWIAVLPFKHRGSDPGVEALAEGITEDIVTGMSRFSYLRVIARSSTSRYGAAAIDVRTVGRELGARYVMEGSIRHTGAMLRVAVQLVDATSGAHLWAETYNRPFSPEKIFELQDDLVPRIVSTVADLSGVLPRTMSEQLRHRDAKGLSPYEAVLRGFGYYERITAKEHAEVRSALERAVEEAPDHADCWSFLSRMYAEEHKHGFNARLDPVGRALEAARRAVAAAPSSNLAYHALAQA
ncbi:MAG TPA: protein kinase, partial [Candidatus Saccharimonadales bacterium]|nr:protein kinase [Candidatus Saccharimonadales bacterium]